MEAVSNMDEMARVIAIILVASVIAAYNATKQFGKLNIRDKNRSEDLRRKE